MGAHSSIGRDMKLSFVIPAHNEEVNIGECLSSILRELEGKPYTVEIIVVNNASTDNTGRIARRFPGVRVVDEPRKGLVIARQAGLTRATGDLVANVDADTRIPPGWIEKVLAEFEKDPKLVCLSGPFIYNPCPVGKSLANGLLWNCLPHLSLQPVCLACELDGSGWQLCHQESHIRTGWRLRRGHRFLRRRH